jgi:PAS domain S-box-containing protein
MDDKKEDVKIPGVIMAKNKTDQNCSGDPTQSAGQTLRRRAEERLKKQSLPGEARTPEETGRLLHELQVHQIELEIQNEELRRTQEELEESRSRYFDLYDLAPVGYLTLSEQGLILEANLTAAQMLGLERSRLTGQPLSRFIFRDDQDIYYLRHKQLFETQTPLAYELRLKRDDGSTVWVQMRTKLTQDDDGALLWRATMGDITERMRAEEALRLAKNGFERQVSERTADLVKEIAERKETEELLRESEKQLRYLSTKILTTQEAERKRVAGELHDSIAASLSALKYSIEHIFQQMEPDGINLARVKDLVSRVQQVIDETRRIMANLRPSILDDLGIIPAIHWLCREFQKTYSTVVIERQINLEENEISESLRTPIFRIVQEALNNVAKHSRATSIHLSFKKNAQGIELDIRDNGQGFDLEGKMQSEDSRRGLGLVSMRERAELSGGSFAIHSERKGGTTIRVCWPLTPQPDHYQLF